MNYQAFIKREGLGHRTADQPLGHTDAEATGQQFVDDEMQGLRHLTPELQNGFGLLLILLAAELRQQGFHPPVQRTGLERFFSDRLPIPEGLPHRRPQQADGFG